MGNERVRPAEERDLPGIVRVALANDQEDCGADPGYVRHLMTHGAFLVAEIADEVVGYGATLDVDGVTVLCDLFVDPARHGSGIGRSVLDVAFDGRGDRVTFASKDPRALPLYTRYGMVPRWPLLYLSRPQGRTGAVSEAVVAHAVTPAEAAKVETALAGVDRSADLAFWAGRPEGLAIVVEMAGAPVAVGAGRPSWLSHLRVAPEAEDQVVVEATLGALGRFGFAGAAVPGPHPALRTLLEQGWRVDDYDHHMSSRDGLLDPRSILSPSFA